MFGSGSGTISGVQLCCSTDHRRVKGLQSSLFPRHHTLFYPTVNCKGEGTPFSLTELSHHPACPPPSLLLLPTEMAPGGWLADTGLIRCKCGSSSSQVTCLPCVGRGSLSSGEGAKNSAAGSSCNSVCAPFLLSPCPSSTLLLHPHSSSSLLFLLPISAQNLLFWNLFLFFFPPQSGKRRLNKSVLGLSP